MCSTPFHNKNSNEVAPAKTVVRHKSPKSVTESVKKVWSIWSFIFLFLRCTRTQQNPCTSSTQLAAKWQSAGLYCTRDLDNLGRFHNITYAVSHWTRCRHAVDHIIRSPPLFLQQNENSNGSVIWKLLRTLAGWNWTISHVCPCHLLRNIGHGKTSEHNDPLQRGLDRFPAFPQYTQNTTATVYSLCSIYIQWVTLLFELRTTC